MESNLKKLGKLLSIFDEKKEEEAPKQKGNNLLMPILKELSVFMEDTVRKSDVQEMMSGFQRVLTQAIRDLKLELREHKAGYDSKSERVQTKVSELISEIRSLEKKINTSNEQALLQQIFSVSKKIDTLASDIRKTEGKIPKVPDHSNNFRNIERSLKEKLTRNDVLDMLNGFTEKFDYIKELEKKFGKETKIISGSIVGRDIIKHYDLTQYLDGVTKTFNIPANWTIISISTSSFPHALRPLIDYTWTQQTLTFTDQISADTTLAIGQTVIITYVVS